MLVPAPAAGEAASSRTSGQSQVAQHEPDQPAGQARRRSTRRRRARIPGPRAGYCTVADTSWSGCSSPVTRPGAHARPARGGAARRAHAPGDARRLRRPGAPARPRARRCARAIEQGRPHSMVLYGPPGSGKTTLARIVAAHAQRRVRGGSAPSRPAAPRSRAVIERADAPPPDRRRADDLLPRRDPPLQQGPAGRAAAGRRGGPGDADRGDDREPVLRGQLGAALAHAGLRAAARSTAEEVAVLLRRALERGECGAATVDDEVIEFLAARAGGDARAALTALELALRDRRRTAARSRSTHAEDALQRKRAALRQATATSTTTTSRPGSRPRAARTPTPRSTTSRSCSRAARTRASSRGGW